MGEKIIKYPVIKAVLYTFIPIIFAIIAGVIISINTLSENTAFIVQAISFAVSIIVGFIIIKTQRFSFKNIGFNGIELYNLKKILYFIPFIIIELLPFFTGFNENNNILRVIILVFFTIAVGINEELYFRGIILNLFKDNIMKALIISSILFGISHIFNAFVNENIIYIILQVIFAFLFGFAAGEIVVITKSIIPVIIIHTAHDFIAFITNDSVNGIGLIVLSIQTVILVIYIFILWKKIEK